MAKGELPNIIFVAPTGKGAQKIRHKHVVFEIVEFYDDATPKLLRLMRDDEVVDLRVESDSNVGPHHCFMTGYCQARSVGPWETILKGAK